MNECLMTPQHEAHLPSFRINEQLPVINEKYLEIFFKIPFLYTFHSA